MRFKISQQQAGFSFIEVLIVILMVGAISMIGWRAYTRRIQQKEAASLSQPSRLPGATVEPRRFDELGITMDIIKGWDVSINNRVVDGKPVLDWIIDKAGADGAIELYAGRTDKQSYNACADYGSDLAVAIVTDVAPTQRPDMLFMAWTNGEAATARASAAIVPAAEAVFWKTNDQASAQVQNIDVAPGTYYYCASMPPVGDSLLLQSTPQSFTKDGIMAIGPASDRSAAFGPAAQSYAEIKAMLISIR